MKKLNLVIVALIAFVSGGLLTHYFAGYEGREQRPQVKDAGTHNANLNTCVAKALEKHMGAILEVELENEDGNWVFDIDVQDADGQTWDIECDMQSLEIVEDSLDRD